MGGIGTNRPRVGGGVWGEFLCGPVSSEHVRLAEQVVGPPLPFDRADAARAALLFNATGRRRGTFTDCMIAATALTVGADVATDNTSDFDRFTPHGLRLVAP